MNAIAISLYDKFDELAVLLDIIRNNWRRDYFVSVCSNHPDAEERMAELDVQVDHFEKGSQITYVDPEVGPRGSDNLNYRIYDSLRRSCLTAINNEDVDHVMHLHADAWPLSEDGLLRLINEMESDDAAVAFPVRIRDFLEEHPPGYFYDQFILFDASQARDVDLFDHSPLELLPQSIHQALPMHCVSRFGWSKILHYSNCENRQHWDGLKLTEVNNHARPMFYDPEYEQIHIAVEDFDDDLGRALQAYYLKEHGLTTGQYIEKHLEEYARPKELLFKQLEEYIESVNRRLRPYGLSVRKFRREMRLIDQFLESSTMKKVQYSVYLNTRDTPLTPVLEGARETLQRLLGKDTHGPEREIAPHETVHDVYAERLDESDFPSELRDDFKRVFLR